MTSRLLACMILAGSAFGVVQPGGDKHPAVQSKAVTAEQPGKVSGHETAVNHEIMIDLDFPGGSLDEFVTLLRAKAPRMNVVVSPSAQAASVPAINLKSAPLDSVLHAMKAVTDGTLLVGKTETESGFVYTLSMMQGMQGPGRASTSIEVFPIHESMGKPQDVLSAIESAVALLQDTKSMKVSFHEPTRLLIVSGTSTHSETVKSVLAALNQRTMDSRQVTEASAGRAAMDLLKSQSGADLVSRVNELLQVEQQMNSAELKSAREQAVMQAKLEMTARDAEAARVMVRERAADSEKARLEQAARIEAMRAESAATKAQMDAMAKQLQDLERQLDVERATNREARNMLENYRSMIDSLKDELNKAKSK